MIKIKRLLSVLCPGLCLTLLLTSCQSAGSAPVTYNDTYFDTVIQLTIYDDADQKLLDKVKETCRKYDNMFNRLNPDSEIARINNAGGQPVAVSPETAQIIQDSLKYSELSGGAFDITIAAVNDLWDFKSESPSVPDAAAIKEALTHVNYKNVIVDGTTVTLKDPQAHLDLGGIAKGYIADKLKTLLKENGVKHALINLGGNVLALGRKPDGSKFNIGIQKPFDQEGNPITSVKIDDVSSVTSGIYERYFKVGDKIYHHLLDPATGYPTENDLLSVTIITGSSTKADALSTACFVLGRERGSELIRNLNDGTKAIYITDDEKIHNVE